jgi:hypothetical protein
MARKAKKPKRKANAKKIAKRALKKARHAPAKEAKADDVNKAMKHAVAQTLATSTDHMPFDLGYSFK